MSTTPLRLWLNHQVLLIMNRREGTAACAARWHAATKVIESGTPVRLELFGFGTPAEAEGSWPGAGRESSGEFIPLKLSGATAEGLLAFLRTALTWKIPAAEKHLLAERLHQIHEASQLPHPPALFTGRPLLCVDLVARSGDCSVYLKGWWRECHGSPVQVTAISPEGERTELIDTLTPFPRRDITPAYSGDTYTGFTACFELKDPSPLRTGWRVELSTTDGFLTDMPAPPAIDDHEQILTAVLPDLQIERPPRLGFAAEQVYEFISRTQLSRLEDYFIVEELQFGLPAAQPVLSVIIPLYGRIDLIEHQLAQFALDPAWADCDLIYLLDSPEHWQRVAWRIEWLTKLYRISLRLIRCNRSGGYAAVNNLGATRARADLLLLLNSDVLPAAPGWIERMIAAYRQRPGIGALGPKLLFEDNSIQHAGVGFELNTDGFGWDTLAFYKGLHRNFPAATNPRPVPAVTGACLMVDRYLFQQVNGFDQGYIQGDFEDMDLCLRLLQAGYQNWYEAGIELYHLEGVSYPLAQRVRHATYNRWLYSRKWSGAIEQIMSRTNPSRWSETQISA